MSNINIDPGSTLTVGTDTISGVNYQIIKVASGDAGTATQVSGTAPFPVTVISATLGTVTITGTVTPSTTGSTITNAAGNPVPVTGNINVATATLGTVTVTGTVSLSATDSTINNSASNPVNVALTSTAVTISNSPLNVNVATATLGTVTVTGTVNPTTTNVTVNIGRTLTGSSGSFSATGATLFTPTNRAKVYAFSITTTAATELICIFHTGGLELWRDTLMAPAGSSAGANLSVAPPGFLFASRAGTAVSLSLNTATLIHWSISLFDEA